MPSIDSWLGNSFPLGGYIGEHDWTVDTAQIIADKTTSITVIRNGVAQTAQTVRLEDMRGAGKTYSDGAVTFTIDALLIGYKGHPTIADTDLKPGDLFVADGVQWEARMQATALTDGLHMYCTVRG